MSFVFVRCCLCGATFAFLTRSCSSLCVNDQHSSDGDGHINFEEFLNGISLMCETGDFDEKVQFSFQVYDFDGDGLISKTELTEMCKGSFPWCNCCCCFRDRCYTKHSCWCS